MAITCSNPIETSWRRRRAGHRQAAPLFNDATVVVQPGAGHFPWIDGPAAFAAAVGSFLSPPPVST
jgi:pimeloyl-ACP methyl ester carboxylesterase